MEIARRAVGLIGAPTSAGAYAPGLEEDPLAMNVEAVRAGALAVADKVATALERELMPMVVGGDCTVELGTVLGWQRHRKATSLVYFDAHPDLNTPDSTRDGAFDWMGMAHMLAVPGARRELLDLGGRVPALAPSDVLVFGYAPARATSAERDAIACLDVRVIEQADVAGDPAGAAASALAWVEERGSFLMHLDVDSIDFAICRSPRTRTATWDCHSMRWRRHSSRSSGARCSEG